MAINTESFKDARDNLNDGLKSVIKETENLLDTTEEHVNTRYENAREKLKSSLHKAKTEFPHLSHKAMEKGKHAAHVGMEKGKHAAHATDEFVGDNPWKAVGVAAAIGLLVGVVIGRGR
ncbi:MAG: hypothetical protein NWQ13_10075 [Glaciimonas sp.]|nr:hypothetical protein [Glaciimonas sp.]